MSHNTISEVTFQVLLKPGFGCISPCVLLSLSLFKQTCNKFAKKLETSKDANEVKVPSARPEYVMTTCLMLLLNGLDALTGSDCSCSLHASKKELLSQKKKHANRSTGEVRKPLVKGMSSAYDALLACAIDA
eukprot:2344165-Amphidinium_carterae.1